MIAGVVAGFGIDVVASFLGVAGGELLIPTMVLLFGIEIKLAGTFVGSLLLGIVPSPVLLPTLAAIRLASAIKIWRHR